MEEEWWSISFEKTICFNPTSFRITVGSDLERLLMPQNRGFNPTSFRITVGSTGVDFVGIADVLVSILLHSGLPLEDQADFV